MRVGFIGLGSQGAPMARRIIESGFDTTLWARRSATLEPFADTAAAIATSPAALGARSDLVCLCVVSDADVREVVTGRDGVLTGMKPGGIIAVHSTVHPSTCRELAQRAAAQGISLIDAPVSGGGAAAAEQHLLVMTGGPAEVVERCRPVLSTYADPLVHLGEVGAGQLTKLLNNLLFTANLATAKSLLDLGRALGIDTTRLGEVVAHGSGNSYALGSLTLLGGSLEVLTGLAGELLRKDVSLIADLTTAAGVSTGPVLHAADSALEMMGRPRGSTDPLR